MSCVSQSLQDCTVILCSLIRWISSCKWHYLGYVVELCYYSHYFSMLLPTFRFFQLVLTVSRFFQLVDLVSDCHSVYQQPCERKLFDFFSSSGNGLTTGSYLHSSSYSLSPIYSEHGNTKLVYHKQWYVQSWTFYWCCDVDLHQTVMRLHNHVVWLVYLPFLTFYVINLCIHSYIFRR